MKIIIKQVSHNEGEFPIEIFVDPEKTTLDQFAQIYLDKLSRRTTYSADIYLTDMIKPTLQRDIMFSDFTFYFSGRGYPAGSIRTQHKLLSEVIKESNLENNECITAYEALSVNGKIHKTVPNLLKLCLFKMNDMLNEGSISKDDIRVNFPQDADVPDEIKKLMK
jgi:hypothetical protein